MVTGLGNLKNAQQTLESPAMCPQGRVRITAPAGTLGPNNDNPRPNPMQ